MTRILRLPEFIDWLAGLRDQRAKAAIVNRIDRAALGNVGNVRAVGEGVSEMKIDVGQGYRVYYVTRGPVVIVLLCGGDKSTQDKDIKRAKKLAKELED